MIWAFIGLCMILAAVGAIFNKTALEAFGHAIQRYSALGIVIGIGLLVLTGGL